MLGRDKVFVCWLQDVLLQPNVPTKSREVGQVG